MSTKTITPEARDIKQSWDRRGVSWNHAIVAVMTAETLGKWASQFGVPPEEIREVLPLVQEIVSAHIENRGERD